jgi:hypothetical protein
MDPYLERRGLWEEVHTQLIVDSARALHRQITPQYQVAIEQRSYMTLLWADELVGLPDVMVINGGGTKTAPAMATSPAPLVAELPMPHEIVERYLEIRESVGEGRVITAIEILSPTNKVSHEGREFYLAKRLKVLGSLTNLVEIDLLRAGQPMAMKIKTPRPADYRIVISRAPKNGRAPMSISLRSGNRSPVFPFHSSPMTVSQRWTSTSSCTISMTRSVTTARSITGAPPTRPSPARMPPRPMRCCVSKVCGRA